MPGAPGRGVLLPPTGASPILRAIRIGPRFIAPRWTRLSGRSARIPVVLARGEVGALLRELDGVERLMASLLYGAGLRLLECCRLRVKDIEFSRSEILLREGKGGKDRVTLLTAGLRAPLTSHLERVKAQHEADLRRELGCVELPQALERKYPRAPFGGLAMGVSGDPLLSRPRDRPAATASPARDRAAARCARGGETRADHIAPCRATRCGIRLRLICSRTATTSGRFRSCSGIGT